MPMPQAAPRTAAPNATYQLSLSRFAAGPECVRRAIDGLSQTALKARPITGKWSVQEIVFHLADAEVVGCERVRRLLAQPGATIQPFDQNRWVEVFAYNERSLEELHTALELFAALRADAARLFRHAAGDDFGKYLDHPEYGRLTLVGILDLYSEHSDKHVAQIHRRRQLLAEHPPAVGARAPAAMRV
jgi:hypothetical protein